MFATAIGRFGASVLLIFALVGGASAADEAAVRAEIAKLLEVGWDATPNGRTEAKEQYAKVKRLAGDSPVALRASLVVLLQQRRYDEAIQRTDELLEADANDLTGLRAKVWLTALVKNYPAAMLAADKLSQRLADDPPRAEDEQAVHDEQIAFLGRIFGFLGGPAAESVSQEDRKNFERQILERITPPRRPVFEEARDGVVAKFLGVTGDKEDERQRAIGEAAAAKEKTLKELESEKEAIAGRAQEIDGRKDKLQKDLREELAEIAKEDQPLVQDLARLESRSRTLNRDLFSYEAEIGRLQGLIAAERDPDRRFVWEQEVNRLFLFVSRLESDLIAVGRLADGVQAQRAALLARQRRAQASAVEQAKRMDQELTNLAKRERLNEAIEKRAAKPASGTTSKTRALTAQAMALSTYDQFPLESERQKLLELLR
jgi:hypothetical protein